MGFSRTLHTIFSKLQAFYGIELPLDPHDFVIDDATLAAVNPPTNASGAEDGEPQKSQVLVQVEETAQGEQHCHLALYFPDQLKQQLDSEDPLTRLSLANLNSLWIVIEELSHFLLLANRSAKDQQTTALELEWQGEIDKVLMAAMVLSEQTGKSQTLDVSTLLHHHCRFTSEDPVYRRAQYFAQKFWYHHKSALSNQQSPRSNLELVARLRTLYPLNWPQKLDKIA